MAPRGYISVHAYIIQQTLLSFLSLHGLYLVASIFISSNILEYNRIDSLLGRRLVSLVDEQKFLCVLLTSKATVEHSDIEEYPGLNHCGLFVVTTWHCKSRARQPPTKHVFDSCNNKGNPIVHYYGSECKYVVLIGEIRCQYTKQKPAPSKVAPLTVPTLWGLRDLACDQEAYQFVPIITGRFLPIDEDC